MNQQLLSEIGRTQRLEILNTLKRTKGLSVNELVAKMKMSYMGIKQHCLTLERDGYLDTWRRPQKMGRPEMVYRLTRRTHDLFPCDSNDFTLELLKSIKEIYGPNGPEKMLFNVFAKRSRERDDLLPAGFACHQSKFAAIDIQILRGKRCDIFQTLSGVQPKKHEPAPFVIRGPIKALHFRQRESASIRSKSFSGDCCYLARRRCLYKTVTRCLTKCDSQHFEREVCRR